MSPRQTFLPSTIQVKPSSIKEELNHLISLHPNDAWLFLKSILECNQFGFGNNVNGKSTEKFLHIALGDNTTFSVATDSINST